MSRSHNESRPSTRWHGVVVNREELVESIKRHTRKDGKVNPCRVMEELMGWPEGSIVNIDQIDMKGTSNKSKNPNVSLHL